MFPFAVAILLGAFLLFGVQPMLGRYLVPWFGGGASTWTTCLVFFQVMLLAGYAWAHGLARRIGPSWQWKAHLALVGVSIAFLPLAPAAETWCSDAAGIPPLRILTMLLVVVGLPYLVLASTGPLMQAWLSRTHPDRSPYRLYALSNLGSLAALGAYPFAIEPTMPLTAQGWWWSGAYIAFAAATVWCGLRLRGTAREAGPRTGGETGDEAATEPIPARRKWSWLACATVGSMLMTATTSRVCEDVAGAPMLWVFPLALYLVTFIICFDRDAWYRRSVFVPLVVVALAAVTLHVHGLLGVVEWSSFALYGAVLFVACMVCHGELVRARPQPRHLTAFYMTIAAGGALGGVLAGVVSPLVFPDYWEYPIGLLATGLIAVMGLHRAWERSPLVQQRFVIGGGVACTLLAIALVDHVVAKRKVDLAGCRGFYGALHVQAQPDALMRIRKKLLHGGVLHGMQFVEADKTAWPTTYYGRESGVGVAIAAARARARREGGRPLNIGVIGLGVGTIAALAERGDSLRLYEINPDVVEYAGEHFSFLEDCEADVEVVLGDGRRRLEVEAARGHECEFDVLAVDAFNGDTVPVNLLTREVLAIYDSHLRGGTGVLAFHVSNTYLDLAPVVRGLADAGGFDMHVVASPGEPLRAGTDNALWVLLTRDPGFAADPHVRVAAEPRDGGDSSAVLWTDDLASVLPVLKRGPSKPRWWQRAPLFGRFVVDDAWLFDRIAQDEMLQGLRLLYRDTERRCPFVFASTDHLPQGRTAKEHAAALFKSFRLDRAAHGALLLVSRQTPGAHLELGPGWTPAQRQQARDLARAAMERQQSPLTERVSRTVVAIDHWLRRACDGSEPVSHPPR